MPAGNKKSRAAKQKQEEGRTTFAKRAARPPSPNKSDYCPTTSDDDLDADGSATDVDSGDDRQRNNEPETSVVALQRLYAVFLPPHLRSDRDTLEKRRKIKNRPAVYAGGSRTTAWRRNVAQKKAAQGCGTLDGFIQRKVGNRNDPENKAPHCPQKRQRNSSPLEEDPVEVPDSGEVSRASSADAESMMRSASPAAVNEQVEIESNRAVTQARSLEDLSAARPEEDEARSVEDSIPAHEPSSIDNTVYQLTAELAKLCLDQSEKSLMLGNDVHEVGGANEFEEELRVRSKSKNSYKMCVLNPFRLWRLWRRRHALLMQMR